MTKVARNGYGRIARNVLRAALRSDAIEAHICKYDSVHGHAG